MGSGKSSDRGLGGLADALKKAGLQITAPPPEPRPGHEQPAPERPRRERPSQDRPGRDRSGDPPSSESARLSPGKPVLTEAAPLDPVQLEELRAAVRADHEVPRGPKRWFYIARDGRVPFADVSDALARQLGDGRAAIVESLGVVSERHVIVSRGETIRALLAADPGIIRFWNRASSTGNGS